MKSLKEVVEASGKSKTFIADSLGLTRAGFYKWLDKGFELDRIKLQRLGEVIGYDFSQHSKTIKETNLENLSQAELIQQVLEHSIQIQSLESRIKALEIKFIQQLLYSKKN